MKRIFLLSSLLFVIASYGQATFSIADYYPLAYQNEWRYTAPENWKEGDYISKIEADPTNFYEYFEGKFVRPI